MPAGIGSSGVIVTGSPMKFSSPPMKLTLLPTRIEGSNDECPSRAKAAARLSVPLIQVKVSPYRPPPALNEDLLEEPTGPRGITIAPSRIVATAVAR